MNSPAPVPTPFQVALERYQNALNYLSLFRDSGGDRIKIYSLKSRGGIWLSHAQPNQRLN